MFLIISGVVKLKYYSSYEILELYLFRIEAATAERITLSEGFWYIDFRLS